MQRAMAQHQLHLGVERARVPELLFQPALRGIDQAGVAGALQHVVKAMARKHPAHVGRLKLFVTGGCAHLPGFVVIRASLPRFFYLFITLVIR